MEVGFVWLARLMFAGIFLLGLGMLFRAWKIGMRKDYRYVADWRGRIIPNGRRWASAVLGINTLGGLGLLTVGVLVLLMGLPFMVWTGTTAFIIWTYFFALQVVMHREKNPQDAQGK